MIRVTVWNEYIHENKNEKVKKVYPHGMHQAIADFLGKEEDMEVRTATLQEPEHGLTNEVLDATDVLIWWGHLAHEEVSDEIVSRVKARVEAGMGLLALHSAHGSKIFRTLSGSDTRKLSWREDEELERLFVVNPSHPIAKGLPEYFEIEKCEMYGEYFNIPQPDELIFISWFEGGEVLRSCFTLRRGAGKMVYFRPGHETLPIYYQKEVQQVIKNAVRWLYTENTPSITYRNNVPLPRK